MKRKKEDLLLFVVFFVYRKKINRNAIRKEKRSLN